MADYGDDPTEVAAPCTRFKDSGFHITVTTKNGAVPSCDSKMLGVTTGALLGVTAQVKTINRSIVQDAKTEQA